MGSGGRPLGFSTDGRVLRLLIKFGMKSHISRVGDRSPPPVRTSSSVASVFVPLIYTDMRTQFSSRVYCTDASPSGGGACMTVGLTKEGVATGRGEMLRSGKTCSSEIPAELAAKALVLGLLRRADHRGTDVRIDVQLPFRSDAWPRSSICPHRWFWKAILSFPWKRPGAHINELELRAVFSLLRGLSRSSNNIGMRFAVLVDSSVVLGIAAKCRSSSHRLNPVLRRLNAHVLASGFYVFFGYVASHANPADAPSRCHSHK